MKKILALLLALSMLLCACAFAEESFTDFCNPNGYTLIRITDAFIGDPALDEEDASEDEAVVQATFGDIEFPEGEEMYLLVGFEENDGDGVFALGIADDAVISMPEDFIYDPINTGKAMTVPEFIEWYGATRETYFAELGDAEDFSVLASFDMTEEGELTRIEYFYVP